ncbi:MAG: hypothetical protein KC656_09110 [Myxococcales bacterium]|nr:hypothetical protein [Myxococcales bacterium]MCB9673094.1 hypothetical protein [Alphaproteobacteria bacterium]MCB9694951.1 hypothetical protein [Alphaproteobacteria bacterium]
MDTDRIELPHATLELQPEGFVVSRQHKDVPQTDELADLLMRETRRLAGQRAAVLVLLNGQPISKGARQRIATADELAAVAMVVSSTVGTMLVNFFMRMNKPKYPFKVFSDEGRARQWLVTEGMGARRVDTEAS